MFRIMKLLRISPCLLFSVVSFAVLSRAAAVPPPSVSGDATPGNHTFSVRAGGIERRYVLHVPPGKAPDSGWPLVIVFHGGGGRAAVTMRTTGWPELADKEGFLAAFPEGTPPDPSRPGRFAGNPQTWNDGSGRTHLAAVRSKAPDIEFTKAMIADIKKRFPVDARRIHATGFSNGGSMTFRVARELSRQIASVAPVAGADWLVSTPPARPIPRLYITGAAAPRHPLAGGGIGVGRKSFGKKPPVAEMIRRWVKLDHCNPHAKTLVDKDGVKAVAWQAPGDPERLVFYTLVGHGHHWPGSRSVLPERWTGPNTTKLDATPLIWKFFRAHPLTTMNSNPAPNPETFTLHPVGKVEKKGDKAAVVVAPEFADALLGLDRYSHVWVIYWFDRNDTPEKRSVLQVHPRGNPENPLTGVFACRSPFRPNLIALSLCKIRSVKGRRVELESIDAFDGTPVLDLKPYIPGLDRAKNAKAARYLGRSGEKHP